MGEQESLKIKNEPVIFMRENRKQGLEIFLKTIVQRQADSFERSDIGGRIWENIRSAENPLIK